MKTKKNKLLIILGLIGLSLAMLIVFFQLPYSATKNEFKNDVQNYKAETTLHNETYTEEELTHFPEAIQKYFKVCGFIGKPKKTSIMVYIKSAPLRETPDSVALIVDYTLFSLATKPIRLAYIDSSLYGIPFEGYDSLQNGVGFMKGTLAKVIPLFNQIGPEMDKAQLLTYLAECFINPLAIMSEYISWETIDVNQVKATISYEGKSSSGIFVFNDEGLVESFYTNERAKIASDGKIEYPLWLCTYENYKWQNDIFSPTSFKMIWRDSTGDFVYFTVEDVSIEYME